MCKKSWNAKRNLTKSDYWSGIKKDNLLKETQLSWYQSIDNKYLWVYVKFDGGLFIPFARQLKSKKSGNFSRGMDHPCFSYIFECRHWHYMEEHSLVLLMFSIHLDMFALRKLVS
jgi:hypothetical protein